MDRSTLDRYTRQHRLGAPAVALALALTGLRPDATRWRRHAAKLLNAAGLGSCAAGLLFFVAANWQDWGVIGRFALLQTALLAAVAVALWRPPPSGAGRGALIAATCTLGALLALYGQTYQTGADLHELFFGWAALALPFALAGTSGALWAIWWTVLNVALALYCGTAGAAPLLGPLLDGRAPDRVVLLTLPCVVDLLGAGAFLAVRRTRWRMAAPTWLVRGLASAGFAAGTLAVLAVVFGAYAPDTAHPGVRSAVVVAFIGLGLAIAAATLRQRRDVFPLALVAGSWIAMSTGWLIEATRFGDLGSMFVVALWLVASSTSLGMLLMHWLRGWAPAAAGVSA